MSLLQAILMGIIQGLTEFLPVSSSGHLAIFKILFGVDTDRKSTRLNSSHKHRSRMASSA